MTKSEATSVLLEKRANGVAVVTLNRPQVLNALDIPAKERLGAIWQDISDDPRVRVAVLTGAGEKGFCAGSDIKEINRTGRMVTTETLLRAIPGVGVPLAKPVIAALTGYCIGMGMTLALHCDLRLAAKDAVLGYPEVKHGIVAAIVMANLVRNVGRKAAFELVATGEPIDAACALALGLINRVAAPEHLLSDALALAEKFAGVERDAMAATKALFYRVLDLPFEQALDAGRDVNKRMRGFGKR